MGRGAPPGGYLGGGRPKGSANKKTQELVALAHAQGITPIEVMTRNMRFWFENGEALTKRLHELAVDVQDADMLKELFGLILKMGQFREKAEACAVDAAPYMHPRLAALTVRGDKENPLVHQIEMSMTPKEAAEEYARAVDATKS